MLQFHILECRIKFKVFFAKLNFQCQVESQASKGHNPWGGEYSVKGKVYKRINVIKRFLKEIPNTE